MDSEINTPAPVPEGQERRKDVTRLDAIVRSAMDAIITIDRNQRIVLFNAAAETMFGCSAADAVDGPLDRFIPARFRSVHRSHIEHFMRTGETARRMGLQTTLRGLRSDAAEFPIEASISQATVGDQLLLTVILRDITERAQAEARLIEAQAELREGEARLEAIVRSAMDAIITTDGDHRVVLFNAAAEAMFGCAAQDALGASLDRFLPARYRNAHHGHIERFMRTGETSRRMGMQRALWALHSDGTEFPIEASISHATVGGHRLLTVILRNITERITAEREIRRTHQELREGEQRLEAIVHSAMDAIITLDGNGHIVLFNEAAEAMFGRPASAAVGGPLEPLLPERFRAPHHHHLERFRTTGTTSRRMGMQTQLWGLRADGSEFPIEASISQTYVAGQQLLTVILRDVTERVNAERQLRRAHQELRDTAIALQEVREAEQTRIARELHDELGQALTALKMDADLLQSMIPAERPDLLEQVDTMRELLDFTVATTRRISADLRPLVLDDLGLGAASEWLMQNVVQRAGLSWNLHVDPACTDLEEPYASALFRIMQESLTNITRHAKAKNVSVDLRRAGAEAVLTVTDDGIGIDPVSRQKPGSFGLRGIGERVLLLGGAVAITGKPDAGTEVVARVPVTGAGSVRTVR
jgi:PAS domain S-box-containing protein